MECSGCGRAAVMHAAYSGAHHCESCFRESIERRIRRRIRKDGLLGPGATPDDPDRWVIGLSGGKDSVVLTRVLHATFAEDPRIELVALTIHEGIEGYRDASLKAAREVTDDLGLRHDVASYAADLDVQMDDVVERDPENLAACAYCGVFRRSLLERYADDLDATLLLTGHNLDDEAQTAMMNLLEGDVEQMAKHYDASLAAIGDRAPSPFVPRAKPLRDIPEKEVGLYARIEGLPVHAVECPHASEAYRGEIRDLILGLEERHPGTRHSILAGYEELAALAAARYNADEGVDLEACERCGSPTTGEVCRKCSLVESIHAAD